MSPLFLGLICLGVVVGIIVVSSYPRWSQTDGERLMGRLRQCVAEKKYEDAIVAVRTLESTLDTLKFPKNDGPSRSQVAKLKKKLQKRCLRGKKSPAMKEPLSSTTIKEPCKKKESVDNDMFAVQDDGMVF